MKSVRKIPLAHLRTAECRARLHEAATRVAAELQRRFPGPVHSYKIETEPGHDAFRRIYTVQRGSRWGYRVILSSKSFADATSWIEPCSKIRVVRIFACIGGGGVAGALVALLSGGSVRGESALLVILFLVGGFAGAGLAWILDGVASAFLPRAARAARDAEIASLHDLLASSLGAPRT